MDSNNGNDNNKTGFELMKPDDRAKALSEEKSVFLNVAKFEQMQRVASMLSRSDFVPERFRGEKNVGNCMVALDMASLMNMHPVMLMRTMYVVHGSPGFEGKFVSALINNSGRYTDPLEYEWKGEQGKMDWGCRAFAKRKSTGKIIHGPWVTWEMVVKEKWNLPKGYGDKQQQSKWTTMPEIMFMYRSAAFFGRAHDADLLLGMQTIEEIEDIGKQQTLYQQPDGSFSTLKPQAEGNNQGAYDVTAQAPDDMETKTAQVSPKDKPEPQAQETIESPAEPPKASDVDDFGMPLDHPLTKKVWFAMRIGSIKDKTGFAFFVAENADIIAKATDECFEAMDTKYQKLYGEPLPQHIIDLRSGKPVTQGTQPENEPDVELLNTEAAKRLAELASKHPKEYALVVAGQVPENLKQILEWTEEINQKVVEAKTGQSSQLQDGPPTQDGDLGPSEGW